MKKVVSVLKWIFTLLIKLFGFLTSPIIFFIVYPFYDKIQKGNFLWYYKDDEDGKYGAKYWRNNKNLKKNFWTSYRWHGFRNPSWNLQASLKREIGRFILISCKGKLIKDDKVVHPSETAVLQYEDENGRWIGNTGDIISKKYSILGKMFIWYSINNKLYFKYSFAGKVIGRLWMNIQMGMDHRALFKIKYKFFKERK